MDYLPKMNQLLTDIDNLEDFIKLSGLDRKINSYACNEILRLIKEAKTRALHQTTGNRATSTFHVTRIVQEEFEITAKNENEVCRNIANPYSVTVIKETIRKIPNLKTKL